MKPPSEGSPAPELIEAAAATWLSLRDRGMSPAETTAFLRWLDSDPRHAETFADLERTWRSFDRLGAPVAAAVPRTSWRRRSLLLGAAAAVAFAALGVQLLRGPERTVATEVGAYRRLELPDGSMAQLNTDSELEYAFTNGERRVRLVRGEVFFSVAKDPARPFLVAAGPVVVRAVGTAFNVRHRADAVEVLVTEGRVRLDPPADAAAPVVEPPLLSAGDRATVARTVEPAAAPVVPAVERVPEPALQRALAWQERRLEFESQPLAEVVAEFNRYNRARLVIEDPVLAARRFSGVFRADGYDAFVSLLETSFGVAAERRGRDLILRPAR